MLYRSKTWCTRRAIPDVTLLREKRHIGNGSIMKETTMKVEKRKPLKAKKAIAPDLPFNPYLPVKKTSLNLRKKKFTIGNESGKKTNSKLLQILKKISL